MLVIATLVAWLLVRLRAVPEVSRRGQLIAFVAACTLIQVIALLLVYQEALEIPHYLGTTGSDSLKYLAGAKSILLGTETISNGLHDFAGGYTVFCYMVLATSPPGWQSPILIALANILLFQLMLVDLEQLMYRAKFSRRGAAAALTLLVLNGALLWTSIRILKDVLFYFLFLEVFLAIIELPARIGWNVIRIAGACTWLSFVRPLSFVLVLLVSIFGRVLQNGTLSQLSPMARRRGIRAILVTFGVLAVAAFVFRDALANDIDNFTRAAATQALKDAEEVGSQSLELFEQPLHVRLAVGAARFFLLPIPVSILTSHSDFGTYVVTAFVGSVLGFFTLVYSIRPLVCMRKSIADGKGLVIALMLMGLAVSFTYVFLSSGNAEARHRMPFLVPFALLAGNEWATHGIPRPIRAAAWVGFVAMNGMFLLR